MSGLRKWVLVFGCVLCFASVANADRMGFLLEEVDGSPAGYVLKLKMPNGSIDSISSSIGVIDLSALGGGTVTGVGDCTTSADCFDGTSDGGTYLRLYDGTSAYLSLTANAVRTLTFASSTANSETLVLTLGDNDNTVSLSSASGDMLQLVAPLRLLVGGGDITLISATGGAGITAGDGTLTLAGRGGGTDETMTLDLNTDNLITIASGSSATFAFTPAVSFTARTTHAAGLTVSDSQTIIFDESAANPNDADVVLSATDGVLTIAAANGDNNENITIDLDAASNVATFASGTSATFTFTPQVTFSANPRIYDGDSHYLTIDSADLSGAATLVVGGTFTDGKWCSYATATGFTCNETAPAGLAADVESIGSGAGACASGACLDGTSDGGQNIALYDGNSHKTTISAGDSTADLTVVLPATAGIAGQYVKTDGAGNWSFDSPAGDGDITAVGNCASSGCGTDADTSSLVLSFEGATANDFEIHFQSADPSADRTITLPDETGSVVVAAAAFASDNRLLRSDGTGVSAQASAITVADTSGNTSGMGTLGLVGPVTISADNAAITHSGSTTLAIASTSGTVSVEDVVFTGGALSGVTTLGLTGAMTISANSAAITHSGSTTLAIASTSGTVSVEGITFTGDAVTGASNVTSTKFTSTELEYGGNITVDAVNAAADSTITLGNSAATYNANVSVDGDVTVQGADLVLISATAGAGVTAGDGTLTLKGLGSGQDESLILDFNGTANTVVLTSGSDATTINANAFLISSNGLTPDADGGASLGTGTTAEWQNLYLNTGGTIAFEAGDVVLTHSANTLTLSGGNLALGANNLTMTGSLAATGNRVTKGWFTDVESTNMPTVGGTAILSSLTAPVFTTSMEAPFIVLGSAATAADAGAVRLANNTNVAWELAATGTDVTLGVNASDDMVAALVAATDIFQITTGNFKVGAGTQTQTLDGADGYITGFLEVDGLIYADGGLTATGTLTANGNTVIGNGDTDTFTIQSMIIGGNSRAVQIAASVASPTYATATNELYVAGDIETAANIYASSITATGAGGIITSKQSGSAGDLGLYEANSTDTDTAGLRGPTALTANTSYRGQFPTARATSANMVLAWTNGSETGTGTPADPYIQAMSFVDLDNYLALTGGTLSGALTLPAVSGANPSIILTQSAGAPSGTPTNGSMWITASGLYAQVAGATVGPFSTGAPAFSAVTAGTNTNALVIGNSGSLAFSGTGTFSAASAASSVPWVVGTATASNTAEGTAYWESDTDMLTIGDAATGISLDFTANTVITFPSATSTLAILGANTFTGAQTIGNSASIVFSGTGLFNATSAASSIPMAVGSATASGVTAAGQMYFENDTEILTIGDGATSIGLDFTPDTVITFPSVTSTLAILGANTFTAAQTIAAAAPGIVLNDSDAAAGTAYVYANSSGGANDMILTVAVEDSTGASTPYIEVDGVSETIDLLKPVVASSTIQGRAKFNSYDTDTTLTEATNGGGIVMLTVAGEITMWDCTSTTIGSFVTLWPRDAEKIEVVPASGDQFYLLNGTGIGANDELDMAATAGAKVTLVCTAENEWRVFSEMATTTDGGAAD